MTMVKELLSGPSASLGDRLETHQGAAKMVFFEHRSGAYMTYESIEAQRNAICSPPS
jgi:hypothetical protein